MTVIRPGGRLDAEAADSRRQPIQAWRVALIAGFIGSFAVAPVAPTVFANNGPKACAENVAISPGMIVEPVDTLKGMPELSVSVRQNSWGADVALFDPQSIIPFNTVSETIVSSAPTSVRFNNIQLPLRAIDTDSDQRIDTITFGCPSTIAQ